MFTRACYSECSVFILAACTAFWTGMSLLKKIKLTFMKRYKKIFCNDGRQPTCKRALAFCVSLFRALGVHSWTITFRDIFTRFHETSLAAPPPVSEGLPNSAKRAVAAQ